MLRSSSTTKMVGATAAPSPLLEGETGLGGAAGGGAIIRETLSSGKRNAPKRRGRRAKAGSRRLPEPAKLGTRGRDETARCLGLDGRARGLRIGVRVVRDRRCAPRDAHLHGRRACRV